VSAGHNIICVQRTQHHFEQSENIIAAPAAQMNDVEALPQMKWASPNDVTASP
jgi:hypothetical protein